MKSMRLINETVLCILKSLILKYLIFSYVTQSYIYIVCFLYLTSIFTLSLYICLASIDFLSSPIVLIYKCRMVVFCKIYDEI